MGVWTKADASTSFDALVLSGARGGEGETASEGAVLDAEAIQKLRGLGYIK